MDHRDGGVAHSLASATTLVERRDLSPQTIPPFAGDHTMNASASHSIDLSRAPAMARLLISLFDRLQVGVMTVQFPDGSRRDFGGKTPGINATLIINDWSACSQILRAGDIGLAEAYRDKKIELPDIAALLLLAMANEDALTNESRLLSVYHSSEGTKFYIITEADRSVTTALLPEDY